MAEHASVPISSIPLAVALWEQPNYGGRKRTFIEAPLDPPVPEDFPDLVDLSNSNFASVTQAIGIHPGPNFDPSEQRTVSFFAGANYGGDELCLSPGAYANLLPLWNFGGKISSVRFNSPMNTPNFRAPGYYQEGINLLPGGYSPTSSAATISPIPLVVRLFPETLELDGFTGYPNTSASNSNYLTLVESALNIGAMFGEEYDQAISAVVVHIGRGGSS